MAEIITLKVTRQHLEYMRQRNSKNGQQITIVSPAFEANKVNKKEILISGKRLIVGDTNAIWLAHNTNDNQRNGFMSIYHCCLTLNSRMKVVEKQPVGVCQVA